MLEDVRAQASKVPAGFATSTCTQQARRRGRVQEPSQRELAEAAAYKVYVALDITSAGAFILGGLDA
ncbi:hypothetical protein M441DRAFT_56782 [Trichoderma asperellum CBS 433.97]|uniref:Uncharacterized protein n=1 Tax=Trichoderma asperellum (strain ATCC 204424 / CBS 433.97 / NBRC 101777) TaxID=1042311 RepID=A0A2T3ZB07_TRIA4|nr:hypothetical protein M441DRAFT_56782 [Trichoderma asperellum CBS 433.97]PTB41985.1 hypothetical protein M441DRAFT_56782 [Trichoderma asperellum CBS 433.97]